MTINEIRANNPGIIFIDALAFPKVTTTQNRAQSVVIDRGGKIITTGTVPMVVGDRKIEITRVNGRESFKCFEVIDIADEGMAAGRYIDNFTVPKLVDARTHKRPCRQF